jgi:hypothetical protein
LAQNFGMAWNLPVDISRAARWRSARPRRRARGLLELRHLVDVRPHCDVGDALEDELDDDRHAELLQHRLGPLEGRQDVLHLGDPDRLAAEAFGDRDMVDAVAAELGRIDVLEGQLHAVVHVEAALRLADQAEIGVVHDDMDVGQRNWAPTASSSIRNWKS